MMFDALQPGVRIDGDELIAPLNPDSRFMPTWKARGSEGEVVLRFLVNYNLDQIPGEDIEPFMNLPPIPGFVPWLGWSIATLDKHKTLVIRRSYFPEQLIDRFPSDAGNPPSSSLLDAFAKLAVTFDMLESNRPTLNFDLSPGNLLLDGDTPLLVDYSLAHHLHFADMDARAPLSRHVEPERGVPLSAAYPSMWQMFAATKSPYAMKIKRTDAQYALAALYAYVRTRCLVFEDPADPFPETTELSLMDSFLAKIGWMLKLHDTVQAYEEQGALRLAMLPDEREHAIVARALARDPYVRFSSCAAFIDTLQRV